MGIVVMLSVMAKGGAYVRNRCYVKQVGRGCGSWGTQAALPGSPTHKAAWEVQQDTPDIPKPNSKGTEWER